jgi:rsbT co-antagonist protein RsbR
MAQQPSVGAEVSEQEVVRRKAFLEFRDDDLANLVSINDVARRYADSMIDDFYKHLLSFKQTSAFLHDAQVLEHHDSATAIFLALDAGKLQSRLRRKSPP